MESSTASASGREKGLAVLRLCCRACLANRGLTDSPSLSFSLSLSRVAFSLQRRPCAALLLGMVTLMAVSDDRRRCRHGKEEGKGFSEIEGGRDLRQSSTRSDPCKANTAGASRVQGCGSSAALNLLLSPGSGHPAGLPACLLNIYLLDLPSRPDFKYGRVVGSSR